MGDMSKKGKREGVNYFNQLVHLGEIACRAAKMLIDLLSNYEDLTVATTRIHKVEKEADEVVHEFVSALSKAFITPIEREDLMDLVRSLDDVVDGIDSVAFDFYIYNITKVEPDVIEFSHLLLKSCESMKKTMEEFKDFKKSKVINSYLIEINDYEEAGDRLYQEAMRKLFTSDKDTLDIVRWRLIYEGMEECYDACENVADVIEGVILKNT